jgi:hypothetical protein
LRPPARSAILTAVLLAAAAFRAESQPVQAPAAVPATAPAAPWVIGIARFVPAKAGDPPSALADTLPRLIVADSKSLPTRRMPEANVAELAARDALRAHFTAGVDLASKLDARSSRFFEPSLDINARDAAIKLADSQVVAAAKKLADLDAADPDANASSDPPAPIDRGAKLWDGHSKGQLIDPPVSSLSQSAKAAAVDLLVTGTIAIRSGYAIVNVRGFDATVERDAFAWKSFCSVDDPAPLAAEIADKIERWVAGRDFARVALAVTPISAAISVNGEALISKPPVYYAYAPEKIRVDASASGFLPKSLDLDIMPGDRKSLSIGLDPLETGSVSLVTDPPGAVISLDSVTIGRSPLSIKLDGGRAIVAASKPGYESQSLVLPASGDSEQSIHLLPSDGLGPSGRISAAKDDFYLSLGWFVVSIPATTLTAAAFRGYDEAYARSGDQSIYVSRIVAASALGLAVVATGWTATMMIKRLVKYLGAAH